MRTIQATAVVTPEHTVTLTTPSDAPAAACEVVIPVPQGGRLEPSAVLPAAPAAFTAAWPVFGLPVRPEATAVSPEPLGGDDAR